MPNLFSPPIIDIEEGHHILVQGIDRQEKTPQFIDLISNGNYQRNVIHDLLVDGKHTRISMFYIDNLLVLTARSEIDVEIASGETVHFLNQSQNNDPIQLPPVLRLERNAISKVVCDPYYNIISQLVEKSVVVGTMWEIYELPNLWKAYLKKQDV